MNKITLEEALEIIRNNITKAYTYACYNKSTKQNTSVLEEQTHRMVDFLFEQLKTPTLDEVVKAWEGILDESDLKSGKKIRVKMIKGSAIIEVFGIWSSDVWASICKINENEIDFNLNISMKNLNAINITIRYLASYKEETK